MRCTLSDQCEPLAQPIPGIGSVYVDRLAWLPPIRPGGSQRGTAQDAPRSPDDRKRLRFTILRKSLRIHHISHGP
jgi:hypothetical protein